MRDHRNGGMVLNILAVRADRLRTRERRLLQRVLRNPQERAIVEAAIDEEFLDGPQGINAAVAAAEEGERRPFLDWINLILDRADEIIAFIEKLLALFELVPMGTAAAVLAAAEEMGAALHRAATGISPEPTAVG